MGYGDGIRRRNRWARYLPDFARRGAIEACVLGLTSAACLLTALGDRLSR